MQPRCARGVIRIVQSAGAALHPDNLATLISHSVDRDQSRVTHPAQLGSNSLIRLIRPQSCSTQRTVTVVIPCYRYGRYLPDAVSTTLAQKGVQVDVIIVEMPRRTAWGQ
jgi:hypothetical protein